ncbi:tyrosine-type recombinase/integrase [Flagellimonas olearia]|uniref:Tyrosine-type recombinase/integrase n=1 Tax=Flagellimonas olearia TaxID=552546 RepID=A0A6I1DUD7_9FLAO|nr:tyrosine-type recombinase/integrase [Allomuricauda olearia]KAB7528430.1 tyrosine-type recombinase/integrase [Allomuricauda olearia]
MTGSTYIEFDKATSTAKKLIRLGESPNFGLLVICGINLGLRIDDLLNLTFDQLKKDEFTIVEGKTKKQRTLQVNDNIKEALQYFVDNLTYDKGGHPFTSQKGSVYSVQHVNRLMKQHFPTPKNVSSHSLRKSFGRRVWENNGKSDEALLYLSEIFSHSSPAITRKYLGIRAEEIRDIYLNL